MPIFAINKFQGGISSGSKIGLEGAFRWGRGLDIHSDPDMLQLSPYSYKVSGSTCVDLPVFGTANTTNANMYFLGDAGNVYKFTSVYVLSKIATYTTGQGMGFFNGTGKVIFVSGNTEYKLDPATDAITTGRTLNSSDWHPVECFLDKVFIGNGRELISTDASGIDYTSATIGGGITIEYGFEIKCLKNIGDLLFIGCYSQNTHIAKYYLWDGVSEDYNYSKTLKGEDGINACEVSDDGSVLISAGTQGHFYQLTGVDTPLEMKFALPRIGQENYYTSYYTAEVYPGSMANYHGRVMFAISAGTSATAEKGIYSFASNSANYPKVPNLEYSVSAGSGAYTGTTDKIGAIAVMSNEGLLYGWRNGSTYGIDRTAGFSVQTAAIYESLIIDCGNPFIRKFFKKFKITTNGAIESGVKIELFYKADRGSWVSLGTMDESVDGNIKEKTFNPPSNIKCRELEIKLEFTITSANGVGVDCIAILYEDEEFI